MSSKDSFRTDYHGRGRRAASRRGAGKHSAAGAHLQPVDVDAVAARVADEAMDAPAQRTMRERTPFEGKEAVETAGAGAAHADEERAAMASEAAAAGVAAVVDEQPARSQQVQEELEDDAQTPMGGDAAADAAAMPEHSELPGTVADFSRESTTYRHRRGSNFTRVQKTLLAVVAAVAVVVCVLAGAAFALWQNAEESIQIEDPDVAEALTPTADVSEPYWTLILGSDSRSEETDRARSDVILLCRIDPANKQFTLVSIPRDTKVYLEGYGTQKINAAYALGGAELAISTIEEFAGVQISHYAEIYFSGLEDLVNTLGGVTVDVPEYCSYSDVTLYPGEQTLTGHEALIFARCRKTYSEGDFTRTQCQRILVTALAEKVLSQSVTEIPATIQSISQCFSTDMSLSELVSLATSLQGISSSDIYSGMAPSTTGMVDGVSYTFTYIYQWMLVMQKANNGEKPTLTAKEEEICGTLATDYNTLDMSEGLPADIANELQTYWDKKAAKKAKKEAAAAAAAEADETGTAAQSDDAALDDAA